jgi:hypothetical protein
MMMMMTEVFRSARPEQEPFILQATDDVADNAVVDRPEVIVFPPVIPLVTLAMACALQWLAPLRWIADFDRGWRIGAGAFIVCLSAC